MPKIVSQGRVTNNARQLALFHGKCLSHSPARYYRSGPRAPASVLSLRRGAANPGCSRLSAGSFRTTGGVLLFEPRRFRVGAARVSKRSELAAMLPGGTG